MRHIHLELRPRRIHRSSRKALWPAEIHLRAQQLLLVGTARLHRGGHAGGGWGTGTAAQAICRSHGGRAGRESLLHALRERRAGPYLQKAFNSPEDFLAPNQELSLDDTDTQEGRVGKGVRSPFLT